MRALHEGDRPRRCRKVEALILSTLEDNAAKGFAPRAIGSGGQYIRVLAAREQYRLLSPRHGLHVQCAGTWLHGGDPLAQLHFEDALTALKDKAAKGHFANEIRRLFLDNTHRTTVTLSPTPNRARARHQGEPRSSPMSRGHG